MAEPYRARPASLANQGLDDLGGAASVLARQKKDHVELDRLPLQLEQGSPAEQDSVLLQVYRLVFPHAFAEEAVLWPVIRKVLPDGEVLTLEVEQEHQEINELVVRIEALEPGSAERRPVLDRLVQLLREDVRDEEDVLLPRLQDRLSRRQLRRLGTAWDMVRHVAPTRAHPVVSRRPPGNVVSALPLTVPDRARDRVDRALQDRPADKGAATLRGIGSALGRAARTIEHLPGVGAGEHPSTRAEKVHRLPWAAILVATLAAPLALAATRRGRQA